MQNGAPNSKKCSKGAQRNRERPTHGLLTQSPFGLEEFGLGIYYGVGVGEEENKKEKEYKTMSVYRLTNSKNHIYKTL